MAERMKEHYIHPAGRSPIALRLHYDSDDISENLVDEIFDMLDNDPAFFTKMGRNIPVRWTSDRTYKAYKLTRTADAHLEVEEV
jgi:hypothetical protein